MNVCQCGTCRTCRTRQYNRRAEARRQGRTVLPDLPAKTPEALADEARWERIFQEKFADPDYYGVRPMLRRSTLDRNLMPKPIEGIGNTGGPKADVPFMPKTDRKLLPRKKAA